MSQFTVAFLEDLSTSTGLHWLNNKQHSPYFASSSEELEKWSVNSQLKAWRDVTESHLREIVQYCDFVKEGTLRYDFLIFSRESVGRIWLCI